jgi:hypothetical protein
MYIKKTDAHMLKIKESSVGAIKNNNKTQTTTQLRTGGKQQ